MSDPATLTAAFLLGLFSTLHCIGMCGGIIGALSLSLPDTIRNNKARMFAFILSYNLGRLFSYSMAGFIAGILGASVLQSGGFDQGHLFLRILAALMMAAIGLYLAGWLPQLAHVEKIGIPLWKVLQPVTRKLMPVNSLAKAFSYGLIWGWLPCGMVYFVLVWSLTSVDAVHGALTMLTFGLGTLPGLLSAGIMTSWLTGLSQSTRARRLVGLLIIIMAFSSLLLTMPQQHHHS